ncbi:MAG TPA: hypothetical protein VK878_03205 [Candidatus Deferrimicrobiaceae bacterium]|nr:hypothetical protein [Candidatus Deferrimicrobiaceae bacterium]
MDIPYQGYTIIANSERQPDGRWLPVAELEVSHRGVVTSKPPLRATPREIRATRADADAAAVKMAKAWIDAGEREGPTTRASTPTINDKDRSITADPLPKVPIGSAGASPRMARKTRAQDAPAEAATGVRGADDGRRPTPFGKLDWAGLYQAVGLDSDEQVDRLTRVLVVQFLLDRLVAMVLATKLASSSESNKAPDIENTLRDIAMLPIATRVDLASILGVVGPGVAESIVEVNRLRNRLVRFKPTRGESGRDMSDAEELASQDACDKCLRKGIEAAQKLMSALRVKAKET